MGMILHICWRRIRMCLFSGTYWKMKRQTQAQKQWIQVYKRSLSHFQLIAMHTQRSTADRVQNIWVKDIAASSGHQLLYRLVAKYGS